MLPDNHNNFNFNILIYISFLPVVPIDDSFLMALTRTRSNYENFMSGSCLITKSFMTEDSCENSSLTRIFLWTQGIC